VIMSTLEPEARKLNKVFQKNMTIGLPYITLKFACSADGFIGRADQRIKISNSWSEYIVHKIRHQVDGILIGTNTALIDNPSLTNRLYFGKSPVRIVMDRMGIIPMHYNIFADGGNTWLITENAKNQYGPNVKLLPWNPDLTQLLKDLLNLGLSSILVEGGAKTLDSFIKAKLWDELWCTQSKTTLHYGISAPLISGNIGWSTQIGSDDLRIYYNDEQNR